MRGITYISIVLFCLGGTSRGVAQQLDKWSSYYENGFVWNPALTAKWTNIETTATYERSWIGFQDSPTYATLTFQYPFVSSSYTRSSIGAYVETDQVGPFSRQSVAATYAYTFRPQLFGQYDDALALGLKASMDWFHFDTQKVILFDDDFTSEIDIYADQSTRPNVGFGAFYNSVSDFYALQKNHYYVGLAFNNLIAWDVLEIYQPDSDNSSYGSIAQSPHATMHLGYRMIGGGRGYRSRSTPFYEPNVMLIWGFKNAIHALASFRYEMTNKYWMAGGVATSGEMFTQAGLIFDKRSILKDILYGGVLRMGAKVDYNVSGIRRFAGMGFEIYMAYQWENDSSQHYRG